MSSENQNGNDKHLGILPKEPHPPETRNYSLSPFLSCQFCEKVFNTTTVIKKYDHIIGVHGSNWQETFNEDERHLPKGQEQAYQGGGPISYWCPPQYQRFGYSYQNSPRYFSPPSSPLIPIQAFHADFPNFVPSLGYPLAAYFMAPVSTRGDMMNSPGLRSLNQPEPCHVQQARSLRSSAPTTPSPVTCISSTSVSVRCAANETKCEFGNELGADFSVNRLHYYKLDSVDVRVRNGRKRRGPLFDIYIPEMRSVCTGRSPILMELKSNKSEILERDIKQEVLTPPRSHVGNSHYDANYAPESMEKQLPQPEPKISVKLEFQRKIKEAAKKDQDFLGHNGFVEAITPTPDDVEERMLFPSPLRPVVAVTNDHKNNSTKVPNDVVDSADAAYQLQGFVNEYNELKSLAGIVEPETNEDFRRLNGTSDLESELSGEQMNTGSVGNKPSSTVCLDTERMQLETEDTTVDRRRRSYDFSAISVIVCEYYETEDWKNTRWRIKQNGLFETCAADFVEELITWAVTQAEAQWHSASGTILRLMIKSGLTDKLTVLDIFTVKFIEDRPTHCGLGWTVIVPRLVRLLIEAFFNESNLDWLYKLRQLILQDKYNLHTWEIFATQVVRVFEARTNKDFVLDLARKTKTGVRLPEILPALRDPEDLDEPQTVESPPCRLSLQGSRQRAAHQTALSVYSNEIMEATVMLSSLRLEDVSSLILTEPLFSPPLDANCREDVRIEVVRQNVYYLSKLLHNSEDLLVILHHFGVISASDKIELKKVSSEFNRFVGILAAVITKDQAVFRTFLRVLRETDNTTVADILDAPN